MWVLLIILFSRRNNWLVTQYDCRPRKDPMSISCDQPSIIGDVDPEDCNNNEGSCPPDTTGRMKILGSRILSYSFWSIYLIGSSIMSYTVFKLKPNSYCDHYSIDPLTGEEGCKRCISLSELDIHLLRYSSAMLGLALVFLVIRSILDMALKKTILPQKLQDKLKAMNRQKETNEKLLKTQ